VRCFRQGTHCSNWLTSLAPSTAGSVFGRLPKGIIATGHGDAGKRIATNGSGLSHPSGSSNRQRALARRSPQTAWLKVLHNDARYPGSRTIHYLFHPLHGRELPVARRFGAREILRFELQADDRCVLVPAWMTDAEACRKLTAGDEPRVSLGALLKLVDLVRSADL